MFGREYLSGLDYNASDYRPTGETSTLASSLQLPSNFEELYLTHPLYAAIIQTNTDVSLTEPILAMARRLGIGSFAGKSLYYHLPGPRSPE